MEPELVKLLIETLRDMKASASPVFAELVRQRSLAMWVYAIMGLVAALVGCALFRAVLRWCKTVEDSPKVDKYDEEFGFPVALLAFTAAVVLVIFGVVTTLCCLPYAVAPLGGVLGKIQ